MQQEALPPARFGTREWYERAASHQIEVRLKRLTFTLPAALILLVLLITILLEPLVDGFPAVLIAFGLSALGLLLLSSSVMTIMEVLQGRLYDKSREAAILEERNRIGKDLHDAAIQALYGVQLKLDSSTDQGEAEAGQRREEIDCILEDLNRIIRNMRSYIFDLMPEQREGRSLRESLVDLMREVSVNTLIETDLTVGEDSVADDPTEALSNEQRRLLFLIAREIMANIERHSRAKSVQAEIAEKDGKFRMQIVHDGGGEGDWDAIKEKARSLASRLHIEMRDDGGTAISLNVPLQAIR